METTETDSRAALFTSCVSPPWAWSLPATAATANTNTNTNSNTNANTKK